MWHKMKSIVLATAVVTSAVAVQAGTIVVVDPDAFASGTNISSAFPGVTLSGPGQSITSVFSYTDFLASTGTQLFGSGDNGVYWGDGSNAGMRIVFAALTNYVSIDIIGNDSSDTGQLQAFSTSDTLLGTYTTGELSTGNVENASISRAVPDIAYAIALGTWRDDVSLDNLRYESVVPEPSTIALLGMGALGLLAYGWRRRKRPA